MGNNCCKGKVEPTKKPAFVAGGSSSIKDNLGRLPRVWYEPTEEISASMIEQQKHQEAQKILEELDRVDDDQIAKIKEWREQQNNIIKKYQDLAAKAEAEQVGAKVSDEEAKIAEARRIVAEADAAIALRIKEKEESERVARARAIYEAEQLEATKKRNAAMSKKQERDPSHTIDEILLEARKKVEALLPSN